MAALHSALKYLAPVGFSDIPQLDHGLDQYLTELYAQAQTIVESIPIADPDAVDNKHKLHSTSSVASNASEMTTSAARSDPPSPHHQALQKEWGKPLKLNKNENQLGVSVYKVSGKDGRGAWFARRSVHEGLSFSRFKKAFETEFPTSLAVQGAPGEGNIRGIGAETRVVDINVPHRGKVEVYRLSAQFPGPTTPRDFVTLLITSSRAIKHENDSGRSQDLPLRHYMIVSKPCNHPETQPRDGFIRGQYESVEFIREVPRKLKTSHSSNDLRAMAHKHGHTLEQDVLMHNAAHADHERQHLHVDTSGANSREPSPSGRRRSRTVQVPETPSREHDPSESYDPDDNPVEWIMVTRSDPGGSVPRFLVERGTPSSICADAVKFLDWACGLPDSESPETPMKPHKAFRRESVTNWHDSKQERLHDFKEDDEASTHIGNEGASISPTSTKSEPVTPSPKSPEYQTPHPGPERATSPTIFSSVAGVISAYTPQAVLDHLPHHDAHQITKVAQESAQLSTNSLTAAPKSRDDDTSSIISSTSFASADSHLGDFDPEATSVSSLLDGSSTSTQQPPTGNRHEKELFKLSQRRATLEKKFVETRSKLASQSHSATEKEAIALKKAEERHERELKKHEEKYQKELARIEERKRKEAKKHEDRKKKQADRDEKSKLTRERDEAVAKVQLMEKEREVWLKQVGELQKENTALMQRIGKLEAAAGVEAGKTGRVAAVGGDGQRSRSSSLLGKKNRAAQGQAGNLERVGTGVGSEVSGGTVKSETSSQAS